MVRFKGAGGTTIAPSHLHFHHLGPQNCRLVGFLPNIRLLGTVSLEAVMTDEGPAAYRIVDAVTTEYDY